MIVVTKFNILVIKYFEGSLGIGQVNTFEIGDHWASEYSSEERTNSIKGKKLPHDLLMIFYNLKFSLYRSIIGLAI